MIILVTGDRNWADYRMIRNALAAYVLSIPDEYPSTFIRVVHGAARGADRLAGYAAKSIGADLVEYPADWAKYGHAAGLIRNQFMLDSEKVDLVLAFHDDLENSKGTKDMVNRALKAGIKVILYSHDHPEGVVQWKYYE